MSLFRGLSPRRDRETLTDVNASGHRSLRARVPGGVGATVRQWSSRLSRYRPAGPSGSRGGTDLANGHRPVDFILDCVECGRHWRPDWGQRPPTGKAAVELARIHLADAPTMVPIYAHRFLAAGHDSFAQPVLSMWGTDIMCYGTDLLDYIDREFGAIEPRFPEGWAPTVTIPFWRDYLLGPKGPD